MKENIATAAPIALKALSTALFGACLYALLFMTTSCNTMAGAGQDMQRAGEEVEEASY